MPPEPIIPRDPDDAWVCAIALRLGLPVEVEGLFRMEMSDIHCRVFRIEDAVGRCVRMSKAELRYKMCDVKMTMDAILDALRHLYGPRFEERP